MRDGMFLRRHQQEVGGQRSEGGAVGADAFGARQPGERQNEGVKGVFGKQERELGIDAERRSSSSVDSIVIRPAKLEVKL